MLTNFYLLSFLIRLLCCYIRLPPFRGGFLFSLFANADDFCQVIYRYTNKIGFHHSLLHLLYFILFMLVSDFLVSSSFTSLC